MIRLISRMLDRLMCTFQGHVVTHGKCCFCVKRVRG